MAFSLARRCRHYRRHHFHCAAAGGNGSVSVAAAVAAVAAAANPLTGRCCLLLDRHGRLSCGVRRCHNTLEEKASYTHVMLVLLTTRQSAPRMEALLVSSKAVCSVPVCIPLRCHQQYARMLAAVTQYAVCSRCVYLQASTMVTRRAPAAAQ